jgi:hypothetical protein
MRLAVRIILGVTIAHGVAPAMAGGPPNADPDWPCHQLKVTSLPLATVWEGPALAAPSGALRDDPDVAALATKMTQRRTPVEDVEASIVAIKGKQGAEAKDKLLGAFAMAFGDLTEQRSKILDGLERFGRRQREMGEQIRQENEALQKAVDAAHGERDAEQEELQKRLDWDLRVFNDRRQTIAYVCETPAEIEHRIGAIARAVHDAL